MCRRELQVSYLVWLLGTKGKPLGVLSRISSPGGKQRAAPGLDPLRY